MSKDFQIKMCSAALSKVDTYFLKKNGSRVCWEIEKLSGARILKSKEGAFIQRSERAVAGAVNIIAKEEAFLLKEQVGFLLRDTMLLWTIKKDSKAIK